MLFAVYAAVGLGIAFLLLLGLSALGLAALVVRLVSKSGTMRGAKLYLVLAGLIQPWPFYLWMRLSDWNLKPAALELLWLLSLGLVVGAIITVCYCRWCKGAA